MNWEGTERGYERNPQGGSEFEKKENAQTARADATRMIYPCFSTRCKGPVAGRSVTVKRTREERCVVLKGIDWQLVHGLGGSEPARGAILYVL